MLLGCPTFLSEEGGTALPFADVVPLYGEDRDRHLNIESCNSTVEYHVIRIMGIWITKTCLADLLSFSNLVGTTEGKNVTSS